MGEWVGRQAGRRAGGQASKQAGKENWLSGERWGSKFDAGAPEVQSSKVKGAPTCR